MAYFSSKRDRGLFIAVLCCMVATLVFEFVPIPYSRNVRLNRLLGDGVPALFAGATAVLLMLYSKSRLFSKPTKWLYLLPALFIAVNNFPFYTYFSGQGGIYAVGVGVWIAFAVYCVLVGIFEECIFRGVLFPVLMRRLSYDKKGMILSLVFSSLFFGLSHFLNLIAGAGIVDVLLQVCYSFLLGGLCGFLLIKTQSIFPSIAVHALFNFCGTMLPTLGWGTWANLPTMLCMFIPAALVGAFVIVSLFRYTERERIKLYFKIGF